MLEHLPEKRRKVLKALLAGAVTFFLAPIAMMTSRYLSFAAKRDRNAKATVPLNELQQSKSKLIDVAEEPVIVVLTPENTVRAFTASCTHLGCIVSYRPHLDGFVCKCHNGRFDKNGVNVPGSRPKRPLTELTVQVTQAQAEIQLIPRKA